MFQLGCEIELFQRKNGNLPAKLTELKQPQLLINPKTKSPFVYRKLPKAHSYQEANASEIIQEMYEETNDLPETTRSGELQGYFILEGEIEDNFIEELFLHSSCTLYRNYVFIYLSSVPATANHSL